MAKKIGLYYLFILILTQLPQNGYCTIQSPDILIVNSDTLYLYDTPLKDKEHLILRDSIFSGSNIITTACRRGYRATWKLIDDHLFLTRISECHGSEKTADLGKIFKLSTDQNKVKADWLNSSIIGHNGVKLIGYSFGMSSLYCIEIEFSFIGGKLVDSRLFDNSIAQAPNDNNTRIKNQIIKNLPNQTKRKIRRGKIEIEFWSVVIANIEKEVVDVKYIKKTNLDNPEKIRDILLEIQDWHLVYRRGKLLNDTIAYYIKIDGNDIVNH